MAALTTILAAHFERAAKYATIAGTLFGIGGLVTGLVKTFEESGENAEEAGRQIGRSLLYALPLFYHAYQTVPPWFMRRLALSRVPEGGRVVEGLEELSRLGHRVIGYQDKMISHLPRRPANIIRRALSEPDPSSQLQLGGALSCLPRQIEISDQYSKFVAIRLRRFFRIIRELDKLHEGRHLVWGHEKNPKLWAYAARVGEKGYQPLPLELLKDRFWRWAAQEGRVWDILKQLWLQDRRLFFETVRFWGFNLKRPNERESFRAEYRAVRELLAGVDWQKTFAALYKPARPLGNQNLAMKVREWFWLRSLRRQIDKNMVMAFGMTESQFLRYGTWRYERFNFYIYSEELLLVSGYLYCWSPFDKLLESRPDLFTIF